MVLACDHCRHQWTRGDRRGGLERRHAQQTVPRERREAQRRTRLPARTAATRRSGVPGWSIDIKGEVSAEDDLVLDGSVEGSISMPRHTLTVGVNAHVAAVVAAKNVIVLGSFTGSIIAAARIAIEASAHVTADLVSPALVVVDGAEFTGRVHRPGELERHE
jgi:cytoskeletal protein CcmA (bactofilin family)